MSVKKHLTKAEQELRKILEKSCAGLCQNEFDCRTCEDLDNQMDQVLQWCRAHPDFLDWDAEQEVVGA